jgi:hypothetical protein
LSWDRRIVTLALEDFLGPGPRLQGLLKAPAKELELIAGESVLGEPICLLDCFVHQTHIAPVQHRQNWTAVRALLGLYQPPEHITGLELRIPSIRDFYGSPLADVKRRSLGAVEEVTIKWTSSPELTVQLGDVRLVFDDDWRLDGPMFDLRFQAIPTVRLLSNLPAPQATLEALIDPLLLLIGICLDRPVDIDEIRLLMAGDREVRELSGRRLLVPLKRGNDRPWIAVGNLHPLQRTLELWFAFCRELPTAVAMLTEYLRAGAAPSEDPLLYLARFVEQYHRARFDSYRMPKKEFRARREAVREALDEDLGQWVFDALQYANERGLAERLQELVDLHGDALGAVLGPNPGGFAKAVADTRNYCTHYSSQLASKAATGLELIVLTDRLWALIRACLLAELGFSSDDAKALLELDGRLGWLRLQP